MLDQTTRYGFGTTVKLDVARAIERTKEELAKEGFGILAEMDVAATLNKKLGIDYPPYVILGACNPALAHRALSAEPEIGLLLPCNVVVRAGSASGESIISAMDPVEALGLTGKEEIRPIAEEVRQRLERALNAVAGAAPRA